MENSLYIFIHREGSSWWRAHCIIGLKHRDGIIAEAEVIPSLAPHCILFTVHHRIRLHHVHWPRGEDRE